MPCKSPHRSFTFIDDCVEGVLRLTKSDFRDPLNIGSDEMVSMNEMMQIATSFESKNLPIKHIPVRCAGRGGGGGGGPGQHPPAEFCVLVSSLFP